MTFFGDRHGSLRFACGDCQIVFDLTVAPKSKWEKQYDAKATLDDAGVPSIRAFCGPGERTAVKNRLVIRR
jgi:hypothetical protein